MLCVNHFELLFHHDIFSIMICMTRILLAFLSCKKFKQKAKFSAILFTSSLLPAILAFTLTLFFTFSLKSVTMVFTRSQTENMSRYELIEEFLKLFHVSSKLLEITKTWLKFFIETREGLFRIADIKKLSLSFVTKNNLVEK